jgi:hypothetical protein
MVSVARVLVVSCVLAGCGPRVAETLDEGTTGELTTGELTTGELTSSSTYASSESADTSSEGSSEESSTGDMWIAPSEHAVAFGGCSEGFATLFIEAYLIDDPFGPDFEPPPDSCVAPGDIELDEVLLVYLSQWDGLPGTFEVQPSGPTFASHADEPLSGLATLEVWAPYHSTVLHLNVSGSSGHFVGSLQIEPCGAVDDAPCDE